MEFWRWSGSILHHTHLARHGRLRVRHRRHAVRRTRGAERRIAVPTGFGAGSRGLLQSRTTGTLAWLRAHPRRVRQLAAGSSTFAVILFRTMNPREAFGSLVAKRCGVRRLCAAFGCGAAKKRHSTGALQNLRNPDTGSWEELLASTVGNLTTCRSASTHCGGTRITRKPIFGPFSKPRSRAF